jgi:hypothetical protein
VLISCNGLDLATELRWWQPAARNGSPSMHRTNGLVTGEESAMTRAGILADYAHCRV